ncbi:hypothetical protein BV25DRAFT_1844547 [Artomyces pyxidatus]|uniref:Uncharacterized protein n=1 Tax=Artomyces pyxidatus TaxID=48021 RepID=A0ACB8TK86_9AGAM|nr:hypothetical protein BV25DRAFT_1844547 [Artomyces pyxidatus]
MHLPFTPNHIQLITACYPPSAALLTSGPEYRPNSQELSRLTYYGANRPGKLNKLGGELEKRIKAECRKARAGNARARASLLISLSILKALATECRRDIALLTPPLLAAVEHTLGNFSVDLEVSAKVASLFRAWTTFTDGRLIGVDQNVTKDYLSILERFARMSTTVSITDDAEFRNRTRLVGLAALTGAVTSEALYASTTFRHQVSIIVPALLLNLQEVEISVLENESVTLKQKPSSPYLDEFRTRPAVERRAASIHLHVDGDKGPAMTDVSNSCLRALSSLFDHSNGAQVPYVVQAALNSLDEGNGWVKIEYCRWFAGKATEWTQYQYRYAVPTRLVERLQEDQDMPMTTPLHSALAAMVTTVFTSPTPLVNLSTSDIISNLITIVLRRAAIDPEDTLIFDLTECIASLGTHVYYADQIHDLAGELISRLVTVECNGIPARERERFANDRSRNQALRSLLAGLVGLIRAPGRNEANKEHSHNVSHSPRPGLDGSNANSGPSSPGGASSLVDTPVRISVEHADAPPRVAKRAKVQPETWQDTLNLLCAESYAVRSECARALIFYLESEISKRGEYTDDDGVRRLRPLTAGPVQHAGNMIAMLYGDDSTRFLHAVHVYLYALATAPSLGASSSSSSPSRSANGEDQDGTADGRDSPSRSHGRPSLSIPIRSRKQSMAQQLLEHIPSRLSSSALPSATASDYRNITSVLTTMHEHLPVRELLAGVPFLMALDSVASVGEAPEAEILARALIIKEVVARVWLTLGKIWDSSDIIALAEGALSSIPGGSHLPPAQPYQLGVLTAPEQPVQIKPVPENVANWSGIDCEAALAALTSNKNVLEATAMDSDALYARLASPWNVETALKNSVEPQSNYDALRGDGISPRLKLAPALMHIENMSLQSLTRSTRGVGVTDLRDALEGRSSMSNPALVNKAPSLSTLDHSSSPGDAPFHRLTQTRSRPEKPKLTGSPSEVRDMLNKLRIGRPGGTNSLLKASFPTMQRQETRSSTLIPPYKS